MAILNIIKIIGTALIISSLLILLPGCAKKDPADTVDEEIDNVVKNINESVAKENDRLIKDKPEEEEPDEAIRNASDKNEEVSDSVQNTTDSGK